MGLSGGEVGYGFFGDFRSVGGEVEDKGDFFRVVFVSDEDFVF